MSAATMAAASWKWSSTSAYSPPLVELAPSAAVRLDEANVSKS